MSTRIRMRMSRSRKPTKNKLTVKMVEKMI